MFSSSRVWASAALTRRVASLSFRRHQIKNTPTASRQNISTAAFVFDRVTARRLAAMSGSDGGG